jgi:glycosyltransferase involved in cell wall biosynthesis
MFNLLRKSYEPLIGPYLFKTSDLIICFSNTERVLLIDRFEVPTSKIKVIYHGVNSQEIKSAKPFEFGGKVILHVGRLEKYKNVQIIIESLRFLPKEYRLFIIGEGPFKFTLQQIVYKLNLRDRVKFLGYLSDKLMYRWLKTCSVLIQLSNVESGISLTCIDALAAEKPIIVNNDFVALKETSKLFNNQGVFPFNIKKSSAQELAKLIQNASMVRAKADLSEFDWDVSARKIRDAYLEALN